MLLRCDAGNYYLLQEHNVVHDEVVKVILLTLYLQVKIKEEISRKNSNFY